MKCGGERHLPSFVCIDFGICLFLYLLLSSVYKSIIIFDGILVQGPINFFIHEDHLIS